MRSKPARLHKVDNNDFSILNKLMSMVEDWVLSHSLLCLFVLLAVLTSLFVMVCFAICGISATESGGMRNFVNGGIL